MEHLRISKLYTYMLCLLALLISGSLLTACFYDNEEKLYPLESCASLNVSYNNEILPILESFCYTCHNLANAPVLGDGINLEGHFNFSNYAENFTTKLLGSLKWNGEGSNMPENGSKLDNCTINKIEVWIEEGRLNN